MAPNTLGIIAGRGSLPFEIARRARKAGVRRLVIVGFEGETHAELQDLADAMTCIKVGQLSKLIAYFKQHQIDQCVMGGQVTPSGLFHLRPDFRTAALLFRLKERNAHTLFGGLADELQKDGITLIEATPWLQDLMPETGFRLGSPLSIEQKSDVNLGYRIAKEVSCLNIGQSVVVKKGTILAVEGFEGTDRCLRRGGELAGKKGGAVAVKVAKENHDMRFDIPCIGETTVLACVESGIHVLGLEAKRVIILERKRIENLLMKHPFTMISVK